MMIYSKYKAADFAQFFDLVQEEQVMKYVTGKPLSLEQANKKYESILEINDAHPALGCFMILEDENMLGDCKLVNYKQDTNLFEVGYLLKEAHWGKGLGTKVLAHLLELADTIDPTKDTIGVIDPENIASKRLLEKFGFKSYFVGVENNIPTEKLMLKKSNS